MKHVKSLIVLLSLLFFLLSFSGCILGLGSKRIHGNGSIETQKRSAGTFSKINCSGTFHVFIMQDNSSGVKIEADENIFPYVLTHVSGNELSIKTKNGYSLKPSQAINVYLSMKTIKGFSVSGASKIESRDTLQSDHVKISISGASEIKLQVNVSSLETDVSGMGKIFLKGTADTALYHLSGSTGVKAGNLVTNYTKADISGIADIHVNAQKKLDVTISGSGKVWYKGNPEITQSISGVGKIKKE